MDTTTEIKTNIKEMMRMVYQNLSDGKSDGIVIFYMKDGVIR